MDYIESLGTLTLDHRFKRVMQHLLGEAERVYQDLDLPFRPRWVSTYLLLQGDGPLPVTEIARRIRVTHPGVIQIAREMIEAGVAKSTGDKSDGRRRLLSLTAKGRRLGVKLKLVWRDLARVQERVFRDAGWDPLPMMASLENELRAQSISDSVLKKFRKRETAKGRRRPAGTLS